MKSSVPAYNPQLRRWTFENARRPFSRHLDLDDFRKASRLFKGGFSHCASFMGYANSSGLQYCITAEDARKLKLLAGPHGAVILKAMQAKKS